MDSEPLRAVFEASSLGAVSALATPLGEFQADGGVLRVVVDRAPGRALRVGPGDDVRVQLTLSEAARACGSLALVLRREGRRRSFAFVVAVVQSDGVQARFDLSSRITAGESTRIVLPLGEAPVRIEFEVSAVGAKGTLIDEIVALPHADMELVAVHVEVLVRPLVLGEWSEVAVVTVVTSGDRNPLILDAVTLQSAGAGDLRIDCRSVPAAGSPLGVGRSVHVVTARAEAAEDAVAARSVGIEVPFELSVTIDGREISSGSARLTARSAASLGPLEGTAGTLPSIAFAAGASADGDWLLAIVQSAAVEGDLTVHRSVDGGLTWSSTRERCGAAAGKLLHPTLLHDRPSDTLYLLAGWEPAGTPVYGLGVAPNETAQMLLVASVDQGRTWSTARNLTSAVKDPNWARLIPAGGRGVVTSGGALCVPVLAYEATGAASTPSFGLLESWDRGTTWKVSTLGPEGTMWPAIAEIGDGVLGANVSDLRTALRASLTSRLRRSDWTTLERLNRDVLPAPSGAGALLHVGRATHAVPDRRFVFANAASPRKPARNMLVRGSNDNGTRWPEDHGVLLDDGRGVAAPALGMVGADTVGVLYRSSAGLVVFQRIPLERLVDPVVAGSELSGGQ